MSELNRETALITGANTGLGFEMTSALVERGAHVVAAGRNRDKVEAAIATLADGIPSASLEPGLVDLKSLALVQDFAQRFAARDGELDILINNAGVMVPPAGRTSEGFETQFGVNFVAHFALTGHLFDRLEEAPAARVVTMSSIGHRGAPLDLENFRLEKPYDPWREYGQSKLADLMFALEFDRRLRAKASPVSSLAAHPGVSQTELTLNLGPVPAEIETMSPVEGAAPALVAATAADASSGQYWGPDGSEERSGRPGLAWIDAAALDQDQATRLWDWAEQATCVRYPV